MNELVTRLLCPEPGVKMKLNSMDNSIKAPPEWRCVGLSEVGTSHVKTGKPCQDHHVWENVGQAVVLAVSDGAGSATRSDVGAQLASQLAAKTAKQMLEQHANGLEQLPDSELISLLDSAVAEARAGIVAEAQSLQVPVRDLATTLLLCVSAPSFIASAHIGDGVIVYMGEGLHDVETMSPPEHGRYVNQTFFLTDADFKQRFRTRVIRQPPSCIALFTDGLEPVAWQVQSKKPFEGFLRPIFNYLIENDELQLLEELAERLTSEQICDKTDDDKTLLLACRVRG